MLVREVARLVMLANVTVDLITARLCRPYCLLCALLSGTNCCLPACLHWIPGLKLGTHVAKIVLCLLPPWPYQSGRGGVFYASHIGDILLTGARLSLAMFLGPPRRLPRQATSHSTTSVPWKYAPPPLLTKTTSNNYLLCT